MNSLRNYIFKSVMLSCAAIGFIRSDLGSLVLSNESEKTIQASVVYFSDGELVRDKKYETVTIHSGKKSVLKKLDLRPGYDRQLVVGFADQHYFNSFMKGDLSWDKVAGIKLSTANVGLLSNVNKVAVGKDLIIYKLHGKKGRTVIG